jgi:hypothetical protein
MPLLLRSAPLWLVFGVFSSCDCGLEPLAAPPGSLLGAVCDEETGAPQENRPVRLFVAGRPTPIEGTSDKDGNFAFDNVEPGPAELRFPGGRVVQVEVRSGETTLIDDPACRGLPGQDTGAVRGRVCNAHAGDVVVDAEVGVLVGEELLVTRTDAEGDFLFPVVPVGTWALSVRAPGYSRAEQVTVLADTETVVDPGRSCAVPVPGVQGGVRGRVCAPDGETWLVDARAGITPSGSGEIFTFTDGDGRFELTGVPAGPQQLAITKGSFSTTRAIVIPAGDVLELPEDDCQLETDDLRVAVVTGSQFDNVRGVLRDVGIPDDIVDVYGSGWADDLLGPDERIFDYDILFLSCRSAEPVYVASVIMQDRLRAFLAAGGSVHASDQAYDLIEVTFPDKIEFFGDDTARGAADRGAIVSDLPAVVVDPGLVQALGRNTATLVYRLETWSAMVSAAPDVDVYMSANSPLLGGTTLQNAPHIVGFHHGEGRVVYSSFHQEPGLSDDQELILRLLMFEL